MAGDDLRGTSPSSAATNIYARPMFVASALRVDPIDQEPRRHRQAILPAGALPTHPLIERFLALSYRAISGSLVNRITRRQIAESLE
ncbi:hypothetical protein VTI28DRAFT_8907 [Corynascus sepedonium]